MAGYLAAANRHFDAADLLHANARGVEASHLYAYASECVLKAILEKQGKLEKSCWVHINDHLVKKKSNLIGLFQSAQSGHACHNLPNQLDWFDGWTIDQRYENGASVRPHLRKHKEDAEIIRGVLRDAIRNGVLP